MRALHRAGPRAAAPLVEVNCAAIPETLLEAELFGFERGAFTDARQPKAGLFQTAHGGTLFLDEVGLLPERAQAKFLKVLEDEAVRRLGATQSEPADVALVAATSEDLLDAVRARRFREDLYHRLAVVTVLLPSLAERASDILLLAEHFLGRACADYGLGIEDPHRRRAGRAPRLYLAGQCPGAVEPDGARRPPQRDTAHHRGRPGAARDARTRRDAPPASVSRCPSGTRWARPSGSTSSRRSARLTGTSLGRPPASRSLAARSDIGSRSSSSGGARHRQPARDRPCPARRPS